MKIEAWKPFLIASHYFFIPVKEVDIGWVGYSFNKGLWWLAGTTKFYIDNKDSLTTETKEIVISIFESNHSTVMDETFAIEHLRR